MQADAPGTELREFLKRPVRIKRCTYRAAERVTADVTDRPQAEAEAVPARGCQFVHGLPSYREAADPLLVESAAVKSGCPQNGLSGKEWLSALSGVMMSELSREVPMIGMLGTRPRAVNSRAVAICAGE